MNHRIYLPTRVVEFWYKKGVMELPVAVPEIADSDTELLRFDIFAGNTAFCSGQICEGSYREATDNDIMACSKKLGCTVNEQAQIWAALYAATMRHDDVKWYIIKVEHMGYGP